VFNLLLKVWYIFDRFLLTYTLAIAPVLHQKIMRGNPEWYAARSVTLLLSSRESEKMKFVKKGQMNLDWRAQVLTTI
jgi:hypothetical protein